MAVLQREQNSHFDPYNGLTFVGIIAAGSNIALCAMCALTGTANYERKRLPPVTPWGGKLARGEPKEARRYAASVGEPPGLALEQGLV